METPARYLLAPNVTALHRPTAMKLDGEAAPPYVANSSNPPPSKNRKTTRSRPSKYPQESPAL